MIDVRAFLLGLIAAMPFLLTANLSLANGVSASDNAKNRVSLAARQATLSQQIARDACFVMAGIQPERHADDTESGVRQFDTSLAALVVGDSNLRVNAETDAALKTEIADAAVMWRTLGPAARQLAAGDLHRVPMQQLLALNIEVMDRMTALSNNMARHYAADLPNSLGTTLLAANLLPKLAIKASKEACLVMLDIDRDRNRVALRQTIADLDETLTLLNDGSEEHGIIEPSRQIVRQLKRVKRAWSGFMPQLEAVLETSDFDISTKVTLANMGNEILFEMKPTVSMYLY